MEYSEHIINYWDNTVSNHPKTRQPIISVEGSIWIPEDGTYTFKYITNEIHSIHRRKPIIEYRAGSDSEAHIHLEKGWKPIQINYYNTAKYATLNLIWQNQRENQLAFLRDI